MDPEQQIMEEIFPRLLQISEPHAGTEYDLDQEIYTLGRIGENHLSFPGDDSISRHHARLFQRLGLLWLEDLGSTNGSFLIPPGGIERQLEPNSPALLVEKSRIRLGLKLRFEVHGTTSSHDEATRILCQELQYLLLELYQRVKQLPFGERKIYLDAIHALEKQLATVNSEEELALLAVEGLEKLNEKLNTDQVNVNSLMQTRPVPNLPPLPDDLPDPTDRRRLGTIMNVFITDIRLCFPQDENDANQQ